jgi:hypothetical protein
MILDPEGAPMRGQDVGDERGESGPTGRAPDPRSDPHHLAAIRPRDGSTPRFSLLERQGGVPCRRGRPSNARDRPSAGGGVRAHRPASSFARRCITSARASTGRGPRNRRSRLASARLGGRAWRWPRRARAGRKRKRGGAQHPPCAPAGGGVGRLRGHARAISRALRHEPRRAATPGARARQARQAARRRGPAARKAAAGKAVATKGAAGRKAAARKAAATRTAA